jgi:hypothetical protein
MGIRYPGRAAIDPSAPEAVGVCDRCGQLYNLRDLRYQPVIAGTSTLITRLRVCTVTCLDELNEQERVIRIPPDPMPVSDPRVENFAVDEKNFLQLQAYVGKLSMFGGVSVMGCELTYLRSPVSLDPTFNSTSELDVELKKGINLPTSIDNTSVMNAELTVVAGYTPASIVFNGTDEYLSRTLSTTSPSTTQSTYLVYRRYYCRR